MRLERREAAPDRSLSATMFAPLISHQIWRGCSIWGALGQPLRTTGDRLQCSGSCQRITGLERPVCYLLIPNQRLVRLSSRSVRRPRWASSGTRLEPPMKELAKRQHFLQCRNADGETTITSSGQGRPGQVLRKAWANTSTETCAGVRLGSWRSTHCVSTASSVLPGAIRIA